ncbi:MAG: hypothetical protein QF790_01070 [Gammaproteobacteria bacterium]|jgi:hypothetical protein|nr:hypothetical protein [Gammaproteobacteria bacterium]MDP6615746.1 hypothetical protein [Gammaproteobacteria bacterium]
MRRELSTRATPLFRFVIPAILTINAGIVIWYFGRIGLPGRPDTVSAILGVLLAAALMILARILDRAKRVWVDGDKLIVSDYRREIEIGLAEIGRVTTTPWFNPSRIVVHFKGPTRFGDKIMFFPGTHWFSRSTQHPVAAELEELAGISTQSH